MALRRKDRFLWDFWTIELDGLTWLFMLTAPRDPDPETRHDRARVEVATSRDLTDWEWRGVALEPGPPGAWDDFTIWTGSVAADPAGGFAMLYTGRCRAEDGLVQRIGLARSDDLLHWTKHPDPVLEADPHLYRQRGDDGLTHWRDPWLSWDASEGLWRALVTAQHPDGPGDTAGCIALAESPDLVTWTQRPPVTDERLTEVLEVPQVIDGGGKILVSVNPHHVPGDGKLPKSCMSLLYRRAGDGYSFDRIVESWPSDSRYMLRQVRPGTGLCWMGDDGAGGFDGAISDPFPLSLD